MNPFVCVDCAQTPSPKTYGNLEDLEIHIASDHLEMYIYECEACIFAKFPTEFALKSHMQTNHKMQVFNVKYRYTPKIKAKKQILKKKLIQCVAARASRAALTPTTPASTSLHTALDVVPSTAAAPPPQVFATPTLPVPTSSQNAITPASPSSTKHQGTFTPASSNATKPQGALISEAPEAIASNTESIYMDEETAKIISEILGTQQDEMLTQTHTSHDQNNTSDTEQMHNHDSVFSQTFSASLFNLGDEQAFVSEGVVLPGTECSTSTAGVTKKEGSETEMYMPFWSHKK